MKCSPDTIELLSEMCTGSKRSLSFIDLTNTQEFIHLLTSEANEISEKGNKTIILPEHILKALQVMSISIVFI